MSFFLKRGFISLSRFASSHKSHIASEAVGHRPPGVETPSGAVGCVTILVFLGGKLNVDNSQLDVSIVSERYGLQARVLHGESNDHAARRRARRLELSYTSPELPTKIEFGID